MNKAEIQAILDDCPYHRFLEMTVVSADGENGESVLKLPFKTLWLAVGRADYSTAG